MSEILKWLFQNWVKDPQICKDCGNDQGFLCIVFRSNKDDLGKVVLCSECLKNRKKDGWVVKVL